MDALGLQENDAFAGLSDQTIQAGRAEQAQLFGQDVTRREMATGERDRQADFFNRSGGQAFDQAFTANQANFGQGMQQSAYATQLRQQQMAEEMQKRGYSLNEINALLSGQQVGLPQMPNFMGASAAQPAPIYQAAADQGSVNAALNPWNAVLGAAGSIGGGWLAGR